MSLQLSVKKYLRLLSEPLVEDKAGRAIIGLFLFAKRWYYERRFFAHIFRRIQRP